MNHRDEHFIDRRNGGNHSLLGLWAIKHKGFIRAVAIVALICGYLGIAYLDKQDSIKIQQSKQG